MLITGGLLGLAVAALRSLARSQVITFGDYRALEPGMSYDRVCAVLGRRGQDITAGATGRLYGWTNLDGSRLAALFRNDELVCFGAHGLR